MMSILNFHRMLFVLIFSLMGGCVIARPYQFDYAMLSQSSMRKLLSDDPVPEYDPLFDEEATKHWEIMSTFPHISFDTESGSARISCRTFTNITQKRVYIPVRHLFVYDAIVTDVKTGTRAMLQSSYSREEGLQRITKALIDRLISTGEMKESTACFVPAYSSPLLLIQGACPPKQGIECDTVCKFVCSDASHTLVGSSTIKCLSNGTLSDVFPRCQAKDHPRTHTTTTSSMVNVNHTTHSQSETTKITIPTRKSSTSSKNDSTPGSHTTTPSHPTTKIPPTMKTRSTSGSSTHSEENHTTKPSHSTKRNPTTTKPGPTDGSKTLSHSTQKTPPSTTSFPETSKKFKTMGYVGFVGVPLLLLPAIYIIYQLSHRHRKEQYVIIDEDSADDIDDVPPDVDGYYKAEQIRQAILNPKDKPIELNREECYAMDQKDKGIVFILNNYIFSSDLANERKGSEIDVENIKHVFTEIGYTSDEAHNLTAEGIRGKLKSLNQKILASHTSVVLVFMSHGVPLGILGTDQKVVTVEEIKTMFSGNNCPALNGKPKIMIFQACRGDKATPSAPSLENHAHFESEPEICTDTVRSDGVAGDGGFTMTTKNGESLKLPSVGFGGGELDIDGNVPENADIYIAHATSEGYFSLRHKQNGSWFIQSLCEELIASAHAHHLDDIMTKVTKRVKQREAKIVVQGQRRLALQTPQIVKQGIGKKIFFLPKYQPPSETD